MTSDVWILNTVQGLTVDFVNVPHQSNPRITPSFGPEKDKIIQKEVDSLLAKGAVHEVEPVDGQFISTIFLVDKKTGGKRPVINLKYLNQFVEKNVWTQIYSGSNCFRGSDVYNGPFRCLFQHTHR